MPGTSRPLPTLTSSRPGSRPTLPLSSEQIGRVGGANPRPAARSPGTQPPPRECRSAEVSYGKIAPSPSPPPARGSGTPSARKPSASAPHAAPSSSSGKTGKPTAYSSGSNSAAGSKYPPENPDTRPASRRRSEVLTPALSTPVGAGGLVGFSAISADTPAHSRSHHKQGSSIRSGGGGGGSTAPSFSSGRYGVLGTHSSVFKGSSGAASPTTSKERGSVPRRGSSSTRSVRQKDLTPLGRRENAARRPSGEGMGRSTSTFLANSVSLTALESSGGPGPGRGTASSSAVASPTGHPNREDTIRSARAVLSRRFNGSLSRQSRRPSASISGLAPALDTSVAEMQSRNQISTYTNATSYYDVPDTSRDPSASVAGAHGAASATNGHGRSGRGSTANGSLSGLEGSRDEMPFIELVEGNATGGWTNGSCGPSGAQPSNSYESGQHASASAAASGRKPVVKLGGAVTVDSGTRRESLNEYEEQLEEKARKKNLDHILMHLSLSHAKFTEQGRQESSVGFEASTHHESDANASSDSGGNYGDATRNSNTTNNASGNGGGGGGFDEERASPLNNNPTDGAFGEGGGLFGGGGWVGIGGLQGSSEDWYAKMRQKALTTGSDSGRETPIAGAGAAGDSRRTSSNMRLQEATLRSSSGRNSSFNSNSGAGGGGGGGGGTPDAPAENAASLSAPSPFSKKRNSRPLLHEAPGALLSRQGSKPSNGSAPNATNMMSFNSSGSAGPSPVADAALRRVSERDSNAAVTAAAAAAAAANAKGLDARAARNGTSGSHPQPSSNTRKDDDERATPTTPTLMEVAGTAVTVSGRRLLNTQRASVPASASSGAAANPPAPPPLRSPRASSSSGPGLEERRMQDYALRPSLNNSSTSVRTAVLGDETLMRRPSSNGNGRAPGSSSGVTTPAPSPGALSRNASSTGARVSASVTTMPGGSGTTAGAIVPVVPVDPPQAPQPRRPPTPEAGAARAPKRSSKNWSRPIMNGSGAGEPRQS